MVCFLGKFTKSMITNSFKKGAINLLRKENRLYSCFYQNKNFSLVLQLCLSCCNDVMLVLVMLHSYCTAVLVIIFWKFMFYYRSICLRLATLLKKRLWHRYFPVNFANFLRTIFYRTPLVAASAYSFHESWPFYGKTYYDLSNRSRIFCR